MLWTRKEQPAMEDDAERSVPRRRSRRDDATEAAADRNGGGGNITNGDGGGGGGGGGGVLWRRREEEAEPAIDEQEVAPPADAYESELVPATKTDGGVAAAAALAKDAGKFADIPVSCLSSRTSRELNVGLEAWLSRQFFHNAKSRSWGLILISTTDKQTTALSTPHACVLAL